MSSLPLVLSTVAISLVPSFGFADTLPTPRIAPFSGDRAGAISYTFDDNLRDQFTLAVPMLNESGLKGTFFVIAGKTAETPAEGEQKQKDSNVRKQWGGISWPELKIMADQGHEIASHTWSHRNMSKMTAEEIDHELSKTVTEIQNRTGHTPLTIAFPFNQKGPEIEAAAAKYHVNFRSSQLGTSGKTTTESLNKWADKLAEDKKWGVLMVHGVAQGYAALSDPEILRNHFKYTKSQEKKIWIDTFSNISRYQKERDQTEVSVTGRTGHITCTLNSPLDPLVYNVPLTLVFATKGATAVKAEREGKLLPSEIRNGSLVIEAAPGHQPITIQWK